MLERGGVSCSRLWLRHYLVNLKVVSKTTKCRDFTVISPFFQKCTVIFLIFYRDFLTALLIASLSTCKFARTQKING